MNNRGVYVRNIVIDNKDYKIDLLFFHRRLRRLVVIELEIRDYKPEYKAQVELYLRWLNKYEKSMVRRCL